MVVLALRLNDILIKSPAALRTLRDPVLRRGELKAHCKEAEWKQQWYSAKEKEQVIVRMGQLTTDKATHVYQLKFQQLE